MTRNVTGVEAKEGKFGMYKTLFFDDGSKMSITKQNRCYDTFTGPGEYEINTRQYNGKEVIASAKRIGKADAVAAAASIVANRPMSAAQAAEDRLAFDRQKQRDIMIECYMGIAKDILIANKGADGKEITVKDLGNMVIDLMIAHTNIKEGRAVDEPVGVVKNMFQGTEEPKTPIEDDPKDPEQSDLF